MTKRRGRGGEAAVAPDMVVVLRTVGGKRRELAPTRDDVTARTLSVLGQLRALGVADADPDTPPEVAAGDLTVRRSLRAWFAIE